MIQYSSVFHLSIYSRSDASYKCLGLILLFLCQVYDSHWPKSNPHGASKLPPEVKVPPLKLDGKLTRLPSMFMQLTTVILNYKSFAWNLIKFTLPTISSRISHIDLGAFHLVYLQERRREAKQMGTLCIQGEGVDTSKYVCIIENPF